MKIWFQNHRYKLKKARQEKGLLDIGPVIHMTPSTVAHHMSHTSSVAAPLRPIPSSSPRRVSIPVLVRDGKPCGHHGTQSTTSASTSAAISAASANDSLLLLPSSSGHYHHPHHSQQLHLHQQTSTASLTAPAVATLSSQQTSSSSGPLQDYYTMAMAASYDPGSAQLSYAQPNSGSGQSSALPGTGSGGPYASYYSSLVHQPSSYSVGPSASAFGNGAGLTPSGSVNGVISYLQHSTMPSVAAQSHHMQQQNQQQQHHSLGVANPAAALTAMTYSDIGDMAAMTGYGSQSAKWW